MTMPTDALNIDLLRTLCALPGIPGREEAVRAVVREEMTPLVDEISVDTLGNLIGVRRGRGGPRVMLAAHMDEIGFMVRHIDDKGFLRLQATGGFDVSRLPAQRVLVHSSSGEVFRGPLNVAGKPLHMTPPGEQKPPTVDDLFVDIGLSGDEASELVEIGDMVTLYRELEWSGHNIMTKALDDRVGIFVMLEALRALDGPPQAEIVAVATVQEEVGTRGAGTAAFAIEPDVALALDISPAGDYAGAPEETAGLWLGKGVGIKAMDMSTISSQPLNRHLKQLARDNGIPFQNEILVRGGTDAGAMQRARSGAPASTLSIPVRYAHTVNETCSPTDVQAAIDLLKLFLEHAHEGDYREQ
jgi:endoglucanase